MDVVDLTVRAGRRLLRSPRSPPGARSRARSRPRRRRATSRPATLGVQRVPVDPALEAAGQRRRIEQRRGAHPGQLEHLARQPQQPEPGPEARSPARSRCPCAPSASGRGRSAPARSPAWPRPPQQRAALIEPTLVPQTISTRSPRASSAGSSTDNAPASRRRAPRLPGAPVRSARTSGKGRGSHAAPCGPRPRIPPPSVDLAAKSLQRGLAARVEREQPVDAAEAEDRRPLAVPEHERDVPPPSRARAEAVNSEDRPEESMNSPP